MIWVRKLVVLLLSALLLVSLLGAAFATSADVNLTHPTKIESWLSQSNIYGSFVSSTINQAQNSSSTSSQIDVSLSDPIVQQAANKAFSAALLRQDVNTFLNSNYAWLEGKTNTPNFSIDLTGAKQNFAQQVGQYVTTRLTGLPVCTDAQLASLQSQTIDPLSLTCRPATISPEAEGASVTQQLETNNNFLSSPIITANSLNPNGDNHNQPYYQKLSYAPKAYRWIVKLPLIFGAVALLSAIGIFFIAPGKRKGLRRIASVLLLAGIVLIIVNFVANTIFKKVEARIFNSAGVGQLQRALTAFAHRLESHLVRVDLYFGIAFVVLALVIFIILFGTRHRLPKSSKSGLGYAVADSATTQPATASTGAAVNRKPAMDIVGGNPATKPTGISTAKPVAPPSKPKRPRLIQ